MMEGLIDAPLEVPSGIRIEERELPKLRAT